MSEYAETLSQQTQNICITFIQCWTNVEDVGPTLYKCYTNVLCLLGSLTILHCFGPVQNLDKMIWVLGQNHLKYGESFRN